VSANRSHRWEGEKILITYLRSSSYGAWDMCPHQYALEYILGIKGKANIKADKGNIVHKAFELLAQRKKAEQLGQQLVYNDELDREYNIAELEPDFCLDAAWHHMVHVKPTPHEWVSGDRDDCRKWMWNGLTFNDGIYNPLNHTIISPEQFFDFEIERPWAQYDYADPHTGERLAGRLSIKGTIDLVTEVEPGVIHYIDWKTGRVWDWAKDKEKGYHSLCKDPQLLLYFYALNRLYPDAKVIFVTIFFVQFKKPFTICFEPHHVGYAEQMLERRFNAIRNTVKPRLRKTWKCRAFCWFGRNNWPGTNRTVCDHIDKEIVQLGMDRVIKQYGRPGAYAKYGSGGGQENRD
jgi:hypothetical protein